MKRLNISFEDCSSEQVEIINGLMLGDGCISYPRSTSKYPRLTNVRKASDIEYLKWQCEKLQCFYSATPKLYSKLDIRTQKTYNSCYVSSRSAPAFKEFYGKWYPSGKKIVPRDLVLTPLTIAIWFCDDGHMRFSNDLEKVIFVKFSTDGFTKTDTEFLASLLSNKYSEYFGVYRNGSGYVIGASTNASCKIAKDIDEYLFSIPMSRKAFWRVNSKAATIFSDNYVPIYDYQI